MTNEQAKKMLKAKLECLKHETSGMYSDCNRCNCDECSLNYEQGNMGEQKEALDMAIVAIKALEQGSCEDCVSREEVLKQMKEWRDCEFVKMTNPYHYLEKRIQSMSSVTPARPKGYWIDHSDEGFVECSECGSATNCDGNINELHFCFSCGAKMEGEE